MSLNVKTSDIGWFYHAPSRKKNTKPVIPPPLSQIPGLSNEAYLPPENPPKGRWIKETDSRYVQLAKQGGRPDLLCTITPEPPSEGPVGYPRVDWYYDAPGEEEPGIHEDEDSEPYQFMLPDYMVHRPYKPKTATSKPICSSASGVPYSKPFFLEQDGGHVAHQLTQSVLLDTETEGSGADQTTKQQESRKCGYKGRAKQASKPPSVKLQPPTYGRKRCQ